MFVWNPRFPQMVKPLVITGVDKSADPFCSGHTWMPNGDFYIAGGTNETVPQVPTATGHEHVLRLSYASGNAVWDSSKNPFGGMTPMADRRWYPSVLQLADQRTIIHGTAGTWGGPVIPTRTRDVVLFSDPFFTAPANQLNRMRDISSTPLMCSPSNIQTRLGPYARVFALRNGLAFDAGPDGDSTYWDAANHYGTTLAATHPNCTPIPDRWVKGGVMPEMHAPAHLDGGAVHLITRLQPGESDPLDHGFAETIYQLGGNVHCDHYQDGGEDCCGCSHGTPDHDEGTAIVEKIRNPTPDDALDFGSPPLSWDDSPPDLSAPRADLTAVVLLDGSILVLGGERMDPVGCDGNCTCIAVYTPELYKPPEVFGAGASTAWIAMKPHEAEHRYHSSALLLPTGDVVLAGGKFGVGPPGDPQSTKVVEVFIPPYLYNGPRPIIDTTSLYASIGADQTISYTDVVTTFTLDVALGDINTPIARVAVLRPGSVTHSFDFNQRYVELEIAGTEGPTIDGVVTLIVARPPTIQYTPPGWYLITAVDIAGRPADAKWIRFSP
jgi:hypothetical protein